MFDLRNYFYPESQDPLTIRVEQHTISYNVSLSLLLQLSGASSVMEVLEGVAGVEGVTHQHMTQAVATLHHLLKLCSFVGLADHYEDYRNNQIEFNQ